MARNQVMVPFEHGPPVVMAVARAAIVPAEPV
jgi:hypothetical protein